MSYATDDSDLFDDVDEAEQYLEGLSLLEKIGAATGLTADAGPYREAKEVVNAHATMKRLEPYLEDVSAETAYDVLTYLDDTPAVPANIALKTERNIGEVEEVLDELPYGLVKSEPTRSTGPHTARMYYLTGRGHKVLHQ